MSLDKKDKKNKQLYQTGWKKRQYYHTVSTLINNNEVFVYSVLKKTYNIPCLIKDINIQ